MNLQQLLTILRARWISVAVVFGLCVVTTIVVTLLLPKRYTSTASVVVELRNVDPLSGMPVMTPAIASYMATQVDVLQSGRTARRVIETIGLANNPQVRQQWLEDTRGQGDYEGWIVQLLKKSLDVKPSRESNTIAVSFSSSDPRFSAAMANAFVQAYIDTSIALKTAPAREYNEFFDERSRKARDALEAAQTKLSAYQREKGILATDERLDIETARLQELSSQVVMLQALAAESSGRASQATSNGDRLQEVVTNPLLAQLNMDLSRQQARLEELTIRLGDQNPQVVEVKAQLAELRNRIRAESGRVAASVTVNNSVTQSRLAQVQAALAEQRTRVLKLRQQRDEASVLERDVESARTAYQSLLQRLNQTSVEAQTTQGNSSFLERAYEPSEPASPKMIINLIVASTLGLMLGGALALVRELRDRRLRSLDDISGSLDLPLLGVLPDATATMLARKSAGTLLQRRVLGSLTRA